MNAEGITPLSYQNMQTSKQAWKRKCPSNLPKDLVLHALSEDRVGFCRTGVSVILACRGQDGSYTLGLVWELFLAQLFCTSSARHRCIRIKGFYSELTRLRSVWIKNQLFVNCKKLQSFKFTPNFNPTLPILLPPPSKLGLRNQKHSCGPMLSELFLGKKRNLKNTAALTGAADLLC